MNIAAGEEKCSFSCALTAGASFLLRRIGFTSMPSMERLLGADTKPSRAALVGPESARSGLRSQGVSYKQLSARELAATVVSKAHSPRHSVGGVIEAEPYTLPTGSESTHGAEVKELDSALNEPAPSEQQEGSLR